MSTVRLAPVRASVSRETRVWRTRSHRTARIDRHLCGLSPQPAIRLTVVIRPWGSGSGTTSRNHSSPALETSHLTAVPRETLSTRSTQWMGVILSASRPGTARGARRTPLLITTELTHVPRETSNTVPIQPRRPPSGEYRLRESSTRLPTRYEPLLRTRNSRE